MPGKFISKAIIFATLAVFFSMYQETPAQKNRPKPAKTPAARVKAALPDIRYTVAMSKPATHLLEVTMDIAWTNMPDQLQLKMPVWTPGSYLVREFSRHVQDFSTGDPAGNRLSWRKVDKNTWSIDTNGVKELTVAYRVYANELTVRTNELNDEHAFWNNTALLLFVKGQLSAPATVRVTPYGNWRVATALPSVQGKPNTFYAENFDVLYDSPFEVSDFKEITFDVRGKKHRYVVTGEGNYDLARLAADTAKIIEEGYKIFGELPYNDYTFILNLRGGGGLEHLNSTALQINRWAFKNPSRYKSFLGLVAHEYFHVWNVKRIRPDALGPFDYERENYTKLLWVAEGGTAYYEGLLLVRAGLITDKEFLSGKTAQIKQLQERPGRFQTSLEEASFDAWIKYYRQDENAVNNQISYYDKGEVVSMLLDIAIRTASGGARSYDDVMRYLYNEYFKKGRNYTPEDFQRAAELAAGKSLDDFFAKYVRGRAEIDYNTVLQGVGLQLSVKDIDPDEAYLGVDLSDDGSRLTVRSLPAGTPGYQYGLNTGDQIVAIDGFRADQTFLRNYVDERKPGDTIKLTVFRFDRMREITVTLGSNPRKDYELIPVASPTDEQKRLYRAYLNADL
jgi:predicted metalloprotease with PDZ domain